MPLHNCPEHSLNLYPQYHNMLTSPQSKPLPHTPSAYYPTTCAVLPANSLLSSAQTPLFSCFIPFLLFFSNLSTDKCFSCIPLCSHSTLYYFITVASPCFSKAIYEFNSVVPLVPSVKPLELSDIRYNI